MSPLDAPIDNDPQVFIEGIQLDSTHIEGIEQSVLHIRMDGAVLLEGRQHAIQVYLP